MNNWHSDTMKRFKTLSIDSLEFIREEAHRAAIIGEQIGNPKSGQYRDEVHYASMELKRRADRQAKGLAKTRERAHIIHLQNDFKKS